LGGVLVVAKVVVGVGLAAGEGDGIAVLAVGGIEAAIDQGRVGVGTLQPAGLIGDLLHDDVLARLEARQAIPAVDSGGEGAGGQRVAGGEGARTVIVGKGPDGPARQARIGARLIVPVGVQVVVLAARLGGVLVVSKVVVGVGLSAGE